MGHWNSLHLFDDKIFYGKLVQTLKEDKQKMRDYFNTKSTIIEDPEVFTEERIDEIMDISNELIHSFRVYPKYIKELDNCINAEERHKVKIKLSNEVEDFNNLLLFAVFKECALISPYFMLGKGHILSCINYKTENSPTEHFFNKLLSQQKKGSIISLLAGYGIRNWLTSFEIKQVLKNYKQEVLPNEGLEFSSEFVNAFYKFLELAKNNGLGVISCMDIYVDELNKTPFDMGEIDWQGYKNIAYE